MAKSPVSEIDRSSPIIIGSRDTEPVKAMGDGLGGVSPENRAAMVKAIRTATKVPARTMIDPSKPMESEPNPEMARHPGAALPMPEPGTRTRPGPIVPVAASEVRPQPSGPAHANVQAAPPVKKPKKTAVTLSSPQMGRLRVKVDFLSISGSVIALGYIDDDDTTIIEPPVCQEENPLTVEVGADRYACLSGDWSFESETGGQKVLWVVLVRLAG